MQMRGKSLYIGGGITLAVFGLLFYLTVKKATDSKHAQAQQKENAAVTLRREIDPNGILYESGVLNSRATEYNLAALAVQRQLLSLEEQIKSSYLEYDGSRWVRALMPVPLYALPEGNVEQYTRIIGNPPTPVVVVDGLPLNPNYNIAHTRPFRVYLGDYLYSPTSGWLVRAVQPLADDNLVDSQKTVNRPFAYDVAGYVPVNRLNLLPVSKKELTEAYRAAETEPTPPGALVISPGKANTIGVTLETHQDVLEVWLADGDNSHKKLESLSVSLCPGAPFFTPNLKNLTNGRGLGFQVRIADGERIKKGGVAISTTLPTPVYIKARVVKLNEL